MELYILIFFGLLQIEHFDGLDARTDFFRLCLPRIEFLKHWLAPSLDVSSFRFDGDLLLAFRVIYHSCKERTFLEVLRTVTVMLHYGWIDLKDLGGVGPHFCSFNFIMNVFTCNGPSMCDTTVDNLTQSRTKFIDDILSNYNKFFYGVRPPPTKPRIQKKKKK